MSVMYVSINLSMVKDAKNKEIKRTGINNPFLT